MHFSCECGNQILDTTDYLPYKAYLIPDQDLFDYIDEIDKIIQNVGSNLEEKEDAKQKIRNLSVEYTKMIYQCPRCGNIFLKDKLTDLEMFQGSNYDVNKELLQSVKGDKWQGFLYAEWADNKPDWCKKNGYISASILNEGEDYDNWEELETQYYAIFNNLKEKNLLRSSTLRKNGTRIHSWDIGKGE